jgi:hypothetical protein
MEEGAQGRAKRPAARRAPEGEAELALQCAAAARGRDNGRTLRASAEANYFFALQVLAYRFGRHADLGHRLFQLFARHAQGLGPVAHFPLFVHVDAAAVLLTGFLQIIRHDGLLLTILI